MKNKIILDIGSSTTLFCNKNYCKQIKTTQDPIDIHTNGGIIQGKESCQVPQIGKSNYAKEAMTNIIGLADMRKKFRITYDSDKEVGFLVHSPSKIIFNFQNHQKEYTRLIWNRTIIDMKIK